MLSTHHKVANAFSRESNLRASTSDGVPPQVKAFPVEASVYVSYRGHQPPKEMR